MHQKWKRNVQHGGGAIIPCTWKMHCSENCMEEVKERIQLAIAEMGGESSEMAIEVSCEMFGRAILNVFQEYPRGQTTVGKRALHTQIFSFPLKRLSLPVQ